MLLMLLALIAGLLDGWFSGAFQDSFYRFAEMMLTPIGWVLAVSLGFLLLLAVVSQRAMP
ncbi:MAG: hypothetical protein GY935_19810 [Gammaproteobacteria bacterium]|nr:hypothetical protein [Gammaproteobacteria bacterium]